jgi:hypothetical protein
MLGAQALQVVIAGAAHLHPESQGLVPDKLDDANGLLDGGLLRQCPVQFILVDEHGSCVSLPFLTQYTALLFLRRKGGNTPPISTPNKERRFIPRLKDGAFPLGLL